MDGASTIHLEKAWQCRICLRSVANEWAPGRCSRCLNAAFERIDVYTHKGCDRKHRTFEKAVACAEPSPHEPADR